MPFAWYWWASVLGLFGVSLFSLRFLGRRYGDVLQRTTLRGFDIVVLAFAAFFAGLVPAVIWLSSENVVTANFHRQYHDVWLAKRGYNATWLGAPMVKTPLDMFIYQEIIVETKPDVIVETGTWRGGTSLFFASLFDLLGTEGKVVTVDITAQPDVPSHPRIEYFIGSSTDPEIVQEMASRITPKDKVMVVLDSDHSKQHVLNELSLYADLVTVGDYLVVEDTHLNGHPVSFDQGDPWAAVQEFLRNDNRFEADHSREKYGLTFNPGGWLRRVR